MSFAAMYNPRRTCVMSFLGGASTALDQGAPPLQTRPSLFLRHCKNALPWGRKGMAQARRVAQQACDAFQFPTGSMGISS